MTSFMQRLGKKANDIHDPVISDETLFNLAALVPWDGFGKVPDPFEGSSKMPGMVRVPFDPEDYDQRAASLEREAAKQYFGVTDFTTLREPTADERSNTKLSGLVLMNLRSAAHCRAYAAQLRGEVVKVSEDHVANERAKSHRLARRQLNEVDAAIKAKEKWLKFAAKDIDEAKRIKELLGIAQTAERYEAELPSLRDRRDYFKREVERMSR